jgi:hypothetical protein
MFYTFEVSSDESEPIGEISHNSAVILRFLDDNERRIQSKNPRIDQ